MQFFDEDLVAAKQHLVGTHRLRSPEETLATYSPLCRELGITRLANVTGLDFVGIPVYQCIRPNARTLSVSQGKGLTAAAAKASALMESIEAWHAETMAAPTRFEPASLLWSRERVIDLDRLPRDRGRPFEPDVPRPWVEGFDIARRERVWLPYELAELNRLAGSRYASTFQKNSNGLASGNHLLEAILHGLCEVIERDAFALWHCDASDPDGAAGLVDLDTIDDPGCRHVLDRFRAAGLVVGVVDITSDVGAPCYRCVVVDPPESLRPLGSALGQGCHPAREVALLRALTEAAQTRLTYLAGARDDMTLGDYHEAHNPEEAAGLIATLESEAPRVDFRSRPSLATTAFERDIEVVLAALARVGVDSVAVVDLSQPAYRVPVVKVVVPGLEGLLVDERRYLPGPRARAKLEASA